MPNEKSFKDNAIILFAPCLMSNFVADPTMSAAVSAWSTPYVSSEGTEQSSASEALSELSDERDEYSAVRAMARR